MKKVLTVLLAIAVMFTFSFGSAFADSDDAKAYVDANGSKYYEQIDKYAQAINFTYDEDGYLTKIAGTDVAHKGLLTKSLVDTALADAVDAAKTVLNTEIAKIDYTTVDTTAEAIEALDAALGTAVGELTAANILSDWDSLLKDQLDKDKTAAYELFATFSADNYSANSDDWSKEISSSKYFDDDASKYATAALTGLNDGTYPAKTIVKGLLDTQNQVVTDATGSDAATYATAIGAVRDAMTAVKDILNGHKVGEAPANYYVKAIPTISDLKSDTSLADAKADAIANVTAKLSSKQIDMAKSLQDQIDVLDKKAKLSTDDTKLLNKLKALKASLADDFAKVKEVYTARINNAETTDAVETLETAMEGTIAPLSAEADKNGYTVTETEKLFDDCANYVKWVKDIKEDAEILKSLKNVNGVAYYDEEQINDNLDDVIEDIYDGKYTTYQDAYNDLAAGSDYALVDAKLTYTKIVTGEYTGSLVGEGIKDSDGNEITEDWNKADAERTPAADETVGEMKLGESDAYVANARADGDVAMYDDAQKAELEALVKETEAAIKAAKSISEVEKIFKDAHDKYVDIETTKDHHDAWTSGKVKTAYNKADYDKELKAYADYFVAKASSDYGALDAEEIMTQVVYPIVYEAYTVDELAGKVAEAKAAIDALKTKDELKADKAAVEALIKALPATNAVALTDKDAIVAAADALDDYSDTYGAGAYPVTNETKLDNVKEAYEELAADAIKDAYDALDGKTITVDDEAAIKALRDAFDAHEDFCDDYAVQSTNTITDDQIGQLEDALSAAKVKNVRDLMSKLPANPTDADRAQVEAARAAYDALDLDEQIQIVGSAAYNAMIDAEEALGLNVGTAVKELKITAKSTAKKGSITVKWTVKGDASNIDGYEIWKSTKQSKGYKKAFTTTKQTYKNSKGLKKGTRYYYKVRAYKMVDGVKITSDWSNKAYRKAK